MYETLTVHLIFRSSNPHKHHVIIMWLNRVPHYSPRVGWREIFHGSAQRRMTCTHLTHIRKHKTQSLTCVHLLFSSLFSQYLSLFVAVHWKLSVCCVTIPPFIYKHGNSDQEQEKVYQEKRSWKLQIMRQGILQQRQLKKTSQVKGSTNVKFVHASSLTNHTLQSYASPYQRKAIRMQSLPKKVVPAG